MILTTPWICCYQDLSPTFCLSYSYFLEVAVFNFHFFLLSIPLQPFNVGPVKAQVSCQTTTATGRRTRMELGTSESLAGKQPPKPKPLGQRTTTGRPTSRTTNGWRGSGRRGQSERYVLRYSKWVLRLWVEYGFSNLR